MFDTVEIIGRFFSVQLPTENYFFITIILLYFCTYILNIGIHKV